MAIIRIKRTTSSNLPTGLTFGEMAFVQGSGTTADRLYIADSSGITIWIGAEINPAPASWTDDAAKTQLATNYAVNQRISELATSFNGQTGSVQGVSAMGATAASWKKLSVAFTNSNATQGATGFVNLLGSTWAEATTTNTTVGGLATGSNITGNSVLEILEKMLFTFQSASVSSLSVGSFSSGSLELGQTAASSGTRTVTSSATNTTNIDSLGYSVTYSHTNTALPSGSGSGSLMGATAYATSKSNINLSTDIRSTTIGSSFVFTANVSDYSAWVAYGSPLPTSLGATATTTQSCTWYSRFYWGKSATDALTDPSTLSSGSSGLNVSSSSYSPNTFTITDSTSGYLYLFIHNSYTPTQIRLDNSNGALLGLKDLTQTGTAIIGTVPTTTVTNSHGHSATYKVYQSAFTQAGAFTLWVG